MGRTVKYIEKDTVRAHDMTADGKIRPSCLWRYMQETANHSMRDEGASYSELLQKDLAFLLSRMTMRVLRPLNEYEPITVETWGCPSRGLSFERCYRVLGADGGVAAEGLGIWALLDRATGKLRRTGDLSLGYSVGEPITELSETCRFSIPSDADMTEVGLRKIYYSDTDVMGHMNNTYYPDMLCDFLPEPGKGELRRISISFRREAPRGAEISILRAEAQTGEAGLRRFYFRTMCDGEVGIEAMLELSYEEGEVSK